MCMCGFVCVRVCTCVCERIYMYFGIGLGDSAICIWLIDTGPCTYYMCIYCVVQGLKPLLASGHLTGALNTFVCDVCLCVCVCVCMCVCACACMLCVYVCLCVCVCV